MGIYIIIFCAGNLFYLKERSSINKVLSTRNLLCQLDFITEKKHFCWIKLSVCMSVLLISFSVCSRFVQASQNYSRSTILLQNLYRQVCKYWVYCRLVFRTQSNICDDAFLRKQLTSKSKIAQLLHRRCSAGFYICLCIECVLL